MRCRGGRVAERLADRHQTCRIEPAIEDTTLDRPAISGKLAGTDVVMPALMMKHEQTHGPRLARNKPRIHDQKLGVRH